MREEDQGRVGNGSIRVTSTPGLGLVEIVEKAPDINELYFELVESSRYSDYPWGFVAFEELAKSLNRKLKPKGKFYMLHGIPLAIQIWLYECCSTVPRNVASRVDSQIPRLLNWKTNAPRPRYESLMESMFNVADVKVSFKNIEPTLKEISCFCIPKKVGPVGVSHKEAEVNSDDDFQDPPHPKNYSITQKKHHGDSSSSPVKKKLKQQHKGLDEQTPKRTPPPHTAKKLSVRTPIFMPIQQKEKVSSKKKDLNRSASKKFNPIQSPDLSFCSSGDEDDFVSKKVFHKFRNEKKDKDNEVDNPQMGEAVETTPHHEFSPNFVHDLYKNSKDTLDENDMDQHEARDICESPKTGVTTETTVNTSAEDESKNNKCDAEKIVDTSEVAAEITVNTSAEDESKDNEGAAEKILNSVESNMDNSKLNQQNQSPVHIYVALTEQRKAEQNFSDSQVTIPDELLPSLNVYLNQERSIIVHPSANKAQETPMHISRIKRPSRFKESPFTMNFGSADEGERKLFYQKHPFVSHPVNDIEDTKVINKFLKWLSVDILKFHAKRVLAMYRIDDDSLNAGGKEYHLNEYINGFRMHATVP
ncbi:hypothetical protein FXO37_12095 [Capsicum annuum]|nr:hypothetical protein FXO37_12095 [Capsicum annuum]